MEMQIMKLDSENGKYFWEINVQGLSERSLTETEYRYLKRFVYDFIQEINNGTGK